MALVQGVEQDLFVHAVQELGREHFTQGLFYDLTSSRIGGMCRIGRNGGKSHPATELFQLAAPYVGGHDQDGIAEIHVTSVAVGQASLVKDLQQEVENIGMCLLNFIQQHHRVRFAADAFGQLSPLVVAHIARRCPDQAAYGVFFHVFAHVNAHQVVCRVEHILGKKFGQVRFPHSCGTQEDERADGFVGVLQPGAVAVDGTNHGVYGAVLPYELLLEHFGHVQQPLGLRFGYAAYRDRGDHRYHFGDRICIDFLFVFLLDFVPLVALLAEFFFENALPLAQGSGFPVIFFVHRLALFHHDAVHLLFHSDQLFGQFQVRDVHVRTRFVHHINGLVRQAAVGDVAL